MTRGAGPSPAGEEAVPARPDEPPERTRRTAVSSVDDERMSDERLLARLRTLLARVDAVPPVLVEHARMAFAWRTIDAEIAELSYDSLADREMLAAVRDAGLPGSGPRLLGFDTDVTGDADSALTVEIEVSFDRGRASLLGQLTPPTPATVQVLSSAGQGPVATATADEFGQFHLDGLPGGPVRLRVCVGSRTVDTSWVSYVGLPEAS
jgi:hypothetical protein